MRPFNSLFSISYWNDLIQARVGVGDFEAARVHSEVKPSNFTSCRRLSHMLEVICSVGAAAFPDGFPTGAQHEEYSMKKRILAPALAVAVAVGTVGFAAPAEGAREFIRIGGGAKSGVYYRVASGVCTLVNETLGSQGYSCVDKVSFGSVFNLNSVRRGLFTFGVVQSDRHWQAYNGKADWRGKPYAGLRSVFSVHPETVMLVTRADTGIKSVNDLRGKRVNIGNPGSGQRGNAEAVLRVYGINRDTDIIATELQQPQANEALVKKEIDAFFYTVGNPWDDGVALAERTAVQIVPIDASRIKQLVAAHPYCVLTAIPGGVYKGVDKDVPTYAVKATVVTSERESEEVVYNVVKTVFENLDRFRKMHPAFESLQPRDMLEGLSAPLHPGAVRYYKEKGWM